MPDEIPAAGDKADSEILSDAEPMVSKPITPGVAVLAFIALALLSALVAMAVRNATNGPARSVAAIEAQVREAELRNEINARRTALNLPPLEEKSHGESIEEMTARLKKDADLIVATAAGYQKLMEEKNSQLEARNDEFLQSEQLRNDLAKECSRLKLELQKAMVGGSETEMLRRDLQELKAQRDALQTSLAEATRKIEAMSANPDAEDYDHLKRRYDEAVRARDFFENQVKELKKVPGDQ